MKIIKIIASIIGVLALVFGVLFLIYNKPIPKGIKGDEADALANKMLEAINYNAYQKTHFLEWSFNGGKHTYKWNKKNGTVLVKWDSYTVDLNLSDTALSIVTKENAEVSAKEAREARNTAWNYFNNDSFWLVAPFKVFDKGTERKVVTLDNEDKALLISYSQGGSTPGDSYLWKLNSKGFPESYKMWVNILPIGGVEASWDSWKKMESGIFLPTSHKIGPIKLDMGTVKAYN